MADAALHDSPAPDPDARPSSDGSAGHPGALELRPGPPPMTEELKARLDKVIYSDVCDIFYPFHTHGYNVLTRWSVV